MNLNECNYDLETKFVPTCSNCRIIHFKKRTPVRIGNYTLFVTHRYQIKNCLEGFTSGDLLYALSLLPKEEQEVEIIQKTKFERNLHEQRSVESEFEHEFTQTLRKELSFSMDANYTIEAGGGFDIGIIEAGAKSSLSIDSHFGLDLFKETISKTTSKVSNHYEVSVDIKSQLENQYRSLRKIVNPNPCKVVTYFFKQLNKKYKVEVVLVDVRFDLVQRIPENHLEIKPYFERELRPLIANIEPNIRMDSNFPANVQQRRKDAPLESNSLVSDRNPELRYIPKDELIERIPIGRSLVKQLTEEELQIKIDLLRISNKTKIEIKKEVRRIMESKINNPGYVLYQSEYCLRTNSVIAEPKVSKCSICDCDECECDENKDLKLLELEKMKVEIELLKKQLES